MKIDFIKYIIVPFLMVLSGCSSVSIRNVELVEQYENPKYGVVSEKSKEYLEAVKTCEDRFFSDGVNVNGEVIYNRKKLTSILYKEVRAHIARNRSSFNESKSYDEKLRAGMEYAESAPDHILKIRRKNNGYRHCMKSDMKLVRTNGKFYDRRNGKELYYDRDLRVYKPLEKNM